MTSDCNPLITRRSIAATSVTCSFHTDPCSELAEVLPPPEQPGWVAPSNRCHIQNAPDKRAKVPLEICMKTVRNVHTHGQLKRYAVTNQALEPNLRSEQASPPANEFINLKVNRTKHLNTALPLMVERSPQFTSTETTCPPPPPPPQYFVIPHRDTPGQ